MTTYFFTGLFMGLFFSIFTWLIQGNKLKKLMEKLIYEKEECAILRTKLEAENTARIEERKTLENKIQENLVNEKRNKEIFISLSNDVLKSNTDSLVKIAKEVFENQQNIAHGNIKITIEPIKEQLSKFESIIKELETKRAGAYMEMSEQIRHVKSEHIRLQQETNKLVKALSDSKVRGNWGEMQLKRVVELAGMKKNVDYKEQITDRDDYGNLLRPDMIIKLPGGKNIIIDAKTPLSAYLEAVEEKSDLKKKELFHNHLKQIKNHIDQLGKKEYWKQFNPTPEFVVMFIPLEALVNTVLEMDYTVVEYADTKKVIIASPLILLSLLKAIACGWQHEAIADEMKTILNYGKDLYGYTKILGEHLSDIGKYFTKTIESYNSAIGSIESRFLPKARKLNELAIKSDKKIPELVGISALPRRIDILECEKNEIEDK